MHICSAPVAGGAEIYVADLSRSMVEAGHSVRIVFLSHASHIDREHAYEELFLASLVEAGVSYAFIGHAARTNPILGIARTWRLVREWRPDIIHAHLYYGAVFAAFAKVPLVYTHHSIRMRARWLYPFLDMRVARYVGICDACTQLLEGTTRRPVVRIDNAVDGRRLKPKPSGGDRAQSETLALLTAGRLVPSKDHSRLLAAFAELRRTDVVLQIAGEGPLRACLEEQARSLDISERVRFLGNVSNMSDLMADADVFVMSSAWEGLPIALIEATLAGLPVVVTDVGGCAEIVRRAHNGIVVDSPGVPAYAEALRILLNSRELRETFARNGPIKADCYNLHVAVSNHLSMYHDVVHA